MIYQPPEENLEIVLAATPEQQEIILCPAKFLCLLCGRRWGKTVGCIRNRIIHRCLTRPGFRYLLCAPSLSQVIPELEAISQNPILAGMIRKVSILPYPRIFFKNGSTAAFRSLEKAHLLRRDWYNEIWIDEVQDVDESVLDRVLLPMTADHSGTLGMSGQPRGDCWRYRRFFVPGQNPENHHFIRSWNYSIYDGVMFQTKRGKAEIEQLRSVTPEEDWQVEYMAKPVANSKGVFRGKDLDRAARGMVPDMAVGGHRYIAAVDLGRRVDPTALVVMDSTDLLVVQAEERSLWEDHETTSAVVLREIRKWNQAACIIDVTGSGSGSAAKVDEYIRHYQRTIPSAVPMLWNHNTKKRMIQQLGLAFEQGLISIPAAFVKLIKQLRNYEFKKKGEGVLTYSAPPGEHDDLVAGLAMCYNAHLTGWGGRPAALGQLVGVM